MADEKAKLVLSEEVYRQIKWLTFNFDKEIGAVGIGKIRKDSDDRRYLFIEKLYYPKQEVTTCTVHFTPEMWNDLFKMPEFMDRLKDVCFYWHKHPGSAAHSTTDEKDTFETFVTKDTKWFAFLQTASKSNGNMDREARIDIVRPIRTTILNDNIDLTYELPDEEKVFRKHMEGIIKDCIVEAPKPVACGYSYYNGGYWNKKSGNYIQTHLPSVKTDEVALKELFNIEESPNKIYFDNSYIAGVATSLEEQGSIEASSGRVLVKAGEKFATEMIRATSTGGRLSSYIQRIRTSDDKETHKKEFDIQPKRKMFNDLVSAIKNFFYDYNKHLMVEIEKQEVSDYNKGFEKCEEEEGDTEITVNDDKDMAIITGYEAVCQVITELEAYGFIEWVGFYGTLYEGFSKNDRAIGHLLLGQDSNYIELRGKELVAIFDENNEPEYTVDETGKVEVVGNA